MRVLLRGGRLEADDWLLAIVEFDEGEGVCLLDEADIGVAAEAGAEVEVGLEAVAAKASG